MPGEILDDLADVGFAGCAYLALIAAVDEELLERDPLERAVFSDIAFRRQRRRLKREIIRQRQQLAHAARSPTASCAARSAPTSAFIRAT
jgi:hypothetical protein